MTVATFNDFRTQLAWSQKASEEPFWWAVYSKAFPDMTNWMLCDGNTTSQRLGIDRLIHLASGKTIAVDEKKRSGQWDDILLEYVSVDTTGAPGWMEKDLQIDYLAYAFMPTKICYLFDWRMLRRAWLQFGEQWKRQFQTITARNKTYNTLSVAVPIGVVRKATNRASVIDVSSELADWNPQ